MALESMWRMWRVSLAFAAICGLAFLGCSTSTESTVPNAPLPGNPSEQASPQDTLASLPGGEEWAAAKKIYADNKCSNCHRLGESGGQAGGPSAPKGPGGKGPDLTKTGAKADHTPKWLAEHIRVPQSHRPQSRMPTYGPDKIADADLEKLAAYLSNMK